MTSLSGLSIGIDQASPSSIGRRMEYPLVEQTPPTPTSPSNLIGVDSPPASPLRLPERILEKRLDRLGSLDDSLATPRSVSGEGLGSFAMPIPTPRSRKVDSIQKESPEKQEGQEQSEETRITIGSAQTTGCKGSCGVKPECGWRQVCILPTAVISVCGGGYAYFGMGNPAFAAVLLIGSLFSGGAYFCWGREAQNADMAKLAKKLGKRSKSLGEDRAKIARIASGLSKSTEGVELATRSLSLQSRHLEGQEEVLIKNANELAERVRGFQERVQTLETALTQCRSQLEESNGLNSQLKENLEGTQEENEKLQKNLARLAEQLRRASLNRKRLSQIVTSSESRLQKPLQQFQGLVQDMHQTTETISQQIDLKNQQLTTQLETTRTIITSAEQMGKEGSAKLQSLEQLNRQTEKAREELSKLTQQYEEREKQLRAVTVRIEESYKKLGEERSGIDRDAERIGVVASRSHEALLQTQQKTDALLSALKKMNQEGSKRLKSLSSRSATITTGIEE